MKMILFHFWSWFRYLSWIHFNSYFDDDTWNLDWSSK